MTCFASPDWWPDREFIVPTASTSALTATPIPTEAPGVSARRALRPRASRGSGVVTTTRAHGTRACYVCGPGPGSGPGCRCDACRAANRAHARRRARLTAYGQWHPFVDAEPVRDHIQALSQAGIGRRRVAALAGISDAALGRLL